MIHIFRSEASKHSSLKMNPCLAHHRTSYLLISCKYYIDVGAECWRRTLVTKNYVAAVKVKNKCPSKVIGKMSVIQTRFILKVKNLHQIIFFIVENKRIFCL